MGISIRIDKTKNGFIVAGHGVSLTEGFMVFESLEFLLMHVEQVFTPAPVPEPVQIVPQGFSMSSATKDKVIFERNK